MRLIRHFLFGVAAFIAAQNVFAADTNAVLDAWFAAQKNLQTWSADFVQTRTLKMLTQPLVTEGHVDFSAPDKFRWALGKPEKTIAMGKTNEMFVIYPLLKRAEHYPMGASAPKEWRDSMALLQAGFPRTKQEFSAQFTILSLTETNRNWQLLLQPKSASARQMMPELRLGLATNDYALLSTELIFVDGSRMRNDFTNGIVNPKLDPKVFQWIPPADFKVTDPFGK